MPGGDFHRISEKGCRNLQGRLRLGTLIEMVCLGSLTIVSWSYSTTSSSDCRSGSRRHNGLPQFSSTLRAMEQWIRCLDLGLLWVWQVVLCQEPGLHPGQSPDAGSPGGAALHPAVAGAVARRSAGWAYRRPGELHHHALRLPHSTWSFPYSRLAFSLLP